MRVMKILVLILALLSSVAMAGDSNIVRAYHLDRSGHGASNLCGTSIGCPTLGIWFQNAVAATYTPEIGSAYVMPVNGNPTRVAGATWPAGFSAAPGYAWRLDGTGDYLSIADDPAFDSQDFSVFVCFVPRAAWTINKLVFSKYYGVDQRAWQLYSQDAAGDTMKFLVSKDGTVAVGSYTTIAKASSISKNRMTCVTVSYDYVADGSSVANIWVDELAVATSAAMVGPPFNGTAPLEIGGTAAGNASNVDFYVAAYYPGVLTAADHQKLNRRFRGLYDGSLSTAVTYSAATPPALQVAAPADGVSPFLVDMPANSGMLGKTASCAGVHGSSAVTNLVQRSSFETWAAGAASGWTETPTGTGDATQSTIAAHGSSSIQLANADADDAIQIVGACLTVTGGADYMFSWWDYLVSGTGALDAAIYEDDSADCATPTGHTTIGVVPIATTWTKRVTPYTMQAGTIRAQVWFTLPAAAAQAALVDAVQLRPGGYAIDAYCGADTDASAVCATSLPSRPSALSANGSQTIEATFCTPWAGTSPAADVSLWSSGTPAGANTLGAIIESTTDEPAWYVYDAASAAKYAEPNSANWAANTPYTIRAYMDGLGGLGLTWPVGTWFLTMAGAGTGTRTAAQTTTYLCGSNTAGSDCWITNETTYRGWMQ